MRIEQLFLGLFIVMSLAVVANADTIWLVGNPEPVYGVVKSSNDDLVEFRQTTDGVSFEDVQFEKSSISSMLINVNPRRLESLEFGQWHLWHEYAEELYSQRQDPVARRLAIRLLAIVLHHSKDSLQRNAVLNELIALIENGRQKQTLLQLRYLETGVRQQSRQIESTPQRMPDADSRKAAAQLVKSVRQGVDVVPELNNSKLKETISKFEHVCSWQDLMRIASSNRIEDKFLRRLVALELVLRTTEDQVQGKGRTQESWHLQADQVSTESFSLPTIEDATGVDPEATKYISGKWQTE